MVIGGGFAGINFSNALSRHEQYRVTLVDRNNYNFFTPLLYQVATGFLEPSSISYPFRKLFQQRKNQRFRLGELIRIIPEEKKAVLSTGELLYDYLVLAMGTESNFFGMENVRKNSLPLKSIGEALTIRNMMLQKLEDASAGTDPVKQRQLLNVVIAGGGPTGVEVAGMLAEMKKNILQKDYPELAGIDSKIVLAHALPELLSPMLPGSRKYTYETLLKMGVQIRLNDAVKDYADGVVTFSKSEPVEAATMIWTAGVVSHVIEGIPAACYGNGKRLIVDEFNAVNGLDSIYALGDNCVQKHDPKFPDGHPQLAQVAMQQGTNLAKNFLRRDQNQKFVPFKYIDKGTMAIIGRNKAVAELQKPRIAFTGFMAWLIWIFIHLYSLINYRNRVKTFFNWITAYFSKDQALRMIIKPAKPEK